MARSKRKDLDRDQWLVQLGWDLLEEQWAFYWARKWENGNVLL